VANGASTSIVPVIEDASNLLASYGFKISALTPPVTQKNNPTLYAAMVNDANLLEAYNASGV
jgi:hypothetical protein